MFALIGGAKWAVWYVGTYKCGVDLQKKENKPGLVTHKAASLVGRANYRKPMQGAGTRIASTATDNRGQGPIMGGRCGGFAVGALLCEVLVG